MSQRAPGTPEPVDNSPLLPLPAPAAQKKIFRWFFFGFFAFLLYQLLLILSLFADVIIWAASLALVFWPAYRAIEKRIPGRPGISAGLCTVGVLLLVLIPLSAIFTVVLAQSAQLYPVLQEWLSAVQSADDHSVIELLPGFMQNWWMSFTAWMQTMPMLAEFDFAGFVLRNADTLSSTLANFGAATARNIIFGFINLLLILMLMYFCFRDGEKFLNWFYDVLPMETLHVQDVAGKAYDMVTAVIRGALITAFMQGALALIGYLIADVPLALFFGVLTGFSALIPVVGAGLIWLPVGLFIFTQDPTWGIFVLAWGFFLVSLIDNLLKPILIGSKTRMPILLIFCAMIGGANVYGVTGFIIGPILVSVLLAFVTIFREYYLKEGGLDKAGALNGMELAKEQA
jgi:predicted PurR-regulated permease PerM